MPDNFFPLAPALSGRTFTRPPKGAYLHNILEGDVDVRIGDVRATDFYANTVYNADVYYDAEADRIYVLQTRPSARLVTRYRREGSDIMRCSIVEAPDTPLATCANRIDAAVDESEAEERQLNGKPLT